MVVNVLIIVFLSHSSVRTNSISSASGILLYIKSEQQLLLWYPSLYYSKANEPRLYFSANENRQIMVRIDFEIISDEARGKEETKIDDMEGGEER